MNSPDFSYVLLNRFVIKHCIAREGNETPESFRCRKGLRQWSRFFYLDRGKVMFYTDSGQSFLMEPGDIMYLPYDIEYTSAWTDSRDGHYYTAEFIIEDADGNRIDFADDISILFRDSGEYRHIFTDMVETMAGGALGYHMNCQEQFLRLFRMIAFRQRSEDPKALGIWPAVSLIENKFDSYTDTNELAAMCKMSPATFRRHFLRYAGRSPVKYKNLLRLKKSRELLLTGLYSVEEAGEAVGISDVSYFSKIYTKEFGISPGSDGLTGRRLKGKK